MAEGSDSGHFRIAFIGYREGYGTEDTRAVPESAWDTEPRAGEAARDEERTYFQADILWMTLGRGDAPESVAAFAQIAGDVGDARRGRPEGDAATAARPSLSLGTFVLVKGRRAIAIRDPAAHPARAPAFPGGTQEPDPSPARAGRRRITITYETASALARLDQGYGRGVFTIGPDAGEHAGNARTLFFRIERISQ